MLSQLFPGHINTSSIDSHIIRRSLHQKESWPMPTLPPPYTLAAHSTAQPPFGHVVISRLTGKHSIQCKYDTGVLKLRIAASKCCPRYEIFGPRCIRRQWLAENHVTRSILAGSDNFWFDRMASRLARKVLSPSKVLLKMPYKAASSMIALRSCGNTDNYHIARTYTEQLGPKRSNIDSTCIHEFIISTAQHSHNGAR